MSQNYPIQLGQTITSLLTYGKRQTTYKFALVMALMDYCLENLPRGQDEELVVPIEELAQKVIAYYWPQVEEYNGTIGHLFHGQGSSKSATIPKLISEFKHSHPKIRSAAIAREKSEKYPNLRKRVAFELAKMPLSYLQTPPGKGQKTSNELFELKWQPGQVTRQLLDQLDWSIILQPGVAWSLAFLEPLLRPYLENSWRDEIIRFNQGLKEDRLHEFLFGDQRVAISKLSPALRDLQQNRCFYCSKKLPQESVEVDHVLPWSRTYLNGIANLVAADKKCNGDKSDTLPTIEYFKAAVGREASLLSQIADNFNFPIQLSETLAVGKGLYLSTPSGSNLWAGPNSYESWHGVFSALKAD